MNKYYSVFGIQKIFMNEYYSVFGIWKCFMIEYYSVFGIRKFFMNEYYSVFGIQKFFMNEYIQYSVFKNNMKLHSISKTKIHDEYVRYSQAVPTDYVITRELVSGPVDQR